MAADKLSVLLDLQTRQAEAEIRRLAKAAKSIGKGISGGVGSTEAGGKVRALGTGLSKATVNADEFSKSLEASNARVIAFGASAGLIMGVERAMKAMVKASVQVEKALADVNIIMNLNTKQLQKFSKGMFKVAKDTAQSFETVAEATTEFARQGLSMENTLVRTNDALILTRLTGMQAADSVKSLTAAVNSFNKDGLTSTVVINKMAKVDAAFAVSSEDLAKSISRVGSSAVDAGVSLDQLMAITTAVQQRTARGGAVIGNAFKTIFTRIQRTDVQQKLANIGVATRDMQGNMLDAVTVLQNLSRQFGTLTKSQQASIAENVAGVFQVNILRSALADLSSETALYTGALKASVSATDEAERKNASLNKTMDAFVNQTLANLTEAGAALGGDIFGPAIENVLSGVNFLVDAFKDGGKLGGLGADLGKNLATGIGKFLGGPGLIIIGVAFGRLAQQLAKFAGKAFKDMVGLGQAAKDRLAMEESIARILQKEPGLLDGVEKGTLDVKRVQEKIRNTIAEENSLLVRQKILAGEVATILARSGATVSGGHIVVPAGIGAGGLGGKGIKGFSGKGAFGRSLPGRAQGGLIPNFANLGSAIGREISAGVPASSVRVGSSAALKSSGNPAGVGVYNTRDEPAGLSQGIRRSSSMGINPKSHGIPNFAIGTAIMGMGRGIAGKLPNISSKANSVLGTTSGKIGAGGLGAGIMMSDIGDSAFGRVSSHTLLGAALGGGLPGASIGLVSGLITEAMRAMEPAAEDASDALQDQIEKQITLANASKAVAEGLTNLNEKMSVNQLLTVKRANLEELKSGNPDQFARMQGTEEFAAVMGASTSSEYRAAMKAFSKRAETQNILSRLTVDYGNEDVGNITFDKSLGKQLETRFGVQNQKDSLTARAAKLINNNRGRSVNPRQAEVDSLLELRRNFDLTSMGPGIGGAVGRQFLTSLGGAGMDKGGTFASMVSRGVNFEELQSQVRGASSAEERVALATGFKEEDLKPTMDIIRSVLSPEQMEQFNFALERAYTDVEAYNHAVNESTKLEKQRAGATRGLIDVFNEAAASQEMWRKYQHTLRMAAEAEKRGITHQRKMNSLQDTYNISLASATMGSAGVAGARRSAAIGLAGRNFGDNTATAKTAFSRGSAKVLGDLDFLKFAEGKGMTAPVAQQALDKFKGLRKGDINLDTLREDLKSIKGVKALGGALSPEGLIDDAMLKKVIDGLQSQLNNLKSSTAAATDQQTKDIAAAREKYRLDLEAIKLMSVLNTQKRQEQRLISSALAQQELSEARGLVETGQMGARGRNAAYSASLASDVAARGVGKGDYGRAFQSGFRNEFGYEAVDALEDFENGSRQVAQTMKSSFADAFQSISSGASTVQGALANMAQSILNSISSMSTQMMTNMLFSKMGFSEGGHVPGYNAGGLVTGGSGHKDDVMTKMQGGEYVIKKSAVNKIGLPTLNAINGYANGGSTGPSMGQLGLIAGGASALSGVMGAAMAPDPAKPAPSTNYGFGKGKHGFFGGPDPDARGGDIISGGGTRAGVSLNKAFVYYRRDPETGQLISESRRPTEGRFEVSDRLSLLGRLGEDDPQTSRMFGKEQTMAKYQDYLATETQSRKDQVNAVKDQKKSRLIGAYMNAAMLIGGAKIMDGMSSSRGSVGLGDLSETKQAALSVDVQAAGGLNEYAQQQGYMNYADLKASGSLLGTQSTAAMYGGNNANGGMAKVMGGEYVMSPESVRTHGVGFMTELNRGNVPGFASGGLYGNQTGGTVNNGGSTLNTGGNTSNNVKININIDKSGKAEASADSTSSRKGPSERGDQEEVQNNKEFGDLLQSIVVKEIVQQQRPGGLLNRSTTGV